MRVNNRADQRKLIEAKGMSLVEYAKGAFHMGMGYCEAVAIDLMTAEEREEYREYKTAYLNEALKDCPF